VSRKRIQLNSSEEIATLPSLLKMIAGFTLVIGILVPMLYQWDIEGSDSNGDACDDQDLENERCFGEGELFFPFLTCGVPLILFLAAMLIQTGMHVLKIGGQMVQTAPNSITWKWYTTEIDTLDSDEIAEGGDTPWWEE